MQLDCFLEFKHHPNYQDSVIPIHKHRWQIRVAIASSKGDKVSYSALFTVVNSVLKRYDRVVINDVHPLTVFVQPMRTSPNIFSIPSMTVSGTWEDN